MNNWESDQLMRLLMSRRVDDLEWMNILMRNLRAGKKHLGKFKFINKSYLSYHILAILISIELEI